MSTLNFDILTLVVGHLTTAQEALSVSTLCKAIHDVVLCQTLASVTIKSSAAVLKFPEFIRADPSRRIPLLHSLNVDISHTWKDQGYYFNTHSFFDYEDDDPIVASITSFTSFLVFLFSQTHLLQLLDLEISGYFFVKYPQLREAFANMDCLTRLTIGHATDPVFPVLKVMRSQLRFLKVDGTYTGDHPFSSLITQRHLETLELRQVSRSSTPLLDKEARWPTVTTLKIWGVSPMTPFVTAFPNLRTLHVQLWDLGFEVDKSAPQWPRLDHVHGPQPELQAWYINCPVGWLELAATVIPPSGWGGATEEDTLDLIQRTSPIILSLTVSSNVRSEFFEGLVNVAKQVKLLELTVHDGSGSDGSLMESFLSSAARWLSPLQVLGLCIRVETFNDSAEELARRALRLRSTPKNLLDSLAQSLPRLEIFEISAGPFRTRRFGDEYIRLNEQRMWWRVRRPQRVGEEAVAEAIPQWRGDELKERLHQMDHTELSKLVELNF